jgi:hypothetical protein
VQKRITQKAITAANRMGNMWQELFCDISSASAATTMIIPTTSIPMRNNKKLKSIVTVIFSNIIFSPRAPRSCAERYL